MKTFSERFGLNDKDLKTPEHDEILINLTKDWKGKGGMWTILSECGLKSKIFEEAKIRVNSAYVNTCPFCKKSMCKTTYSNEKKKLISIGISSLSASLEKEVPIVNNGYAIGFLDGVLNCTADVIVNYDGETPEKNDGIGKFLLPIEVKTSITNFGEVLRQIKFYQAYLHPKDNIVGFLLITTSDNFKKEFEEEGITFYNINKTQTQL